MRVPKGLQPLIEQGVIDEVVCALKSGKEASVYIVTRREQTLCAKVYKDAEHRGFHKLAEYQEGRKFRGSRDARAMGRRGRHGRRVQETEWKNAEVDALYNFDRAGVRVPRPEGVHDGVLLMELIRDADGVTAPQLHDVDMTADQAREWHAFMMQQIVRMLCSGFIHGDLSAYNVLIDARGPVIIDLPQAVNAAGNNNAFRMLARDVNNMRVCFGRYAPDLLKTHYAHEIWARYEAGTLNPDSALTGTFVFDETPADVDGVLDEIEAVRLQVEARQRGREEADSDG